jgi:hypothetical protein
MKHATKLDYQIDMRHLETATVTPFRDYARLQRYAKGLPGDYDELARTGWSASNRSISNDECFIDQLPSNLLSLERPFVLYLELPASNLDNPLLPAHRDYGKRCSINIYLETNEEPTIFYNWNREQQISEYDEEFCATNGDVWLMNTDVPHSVLLKQNKARRMITICFAKLKYNEVLECFTTK